jgi:hypothetical protein
MRALPEIKICIRSQSALVLFLTAFWCFTLYADWHKEINDWLSPFLGAAFCFLPFIIPIFTIILIVSYHRTDRQYRRWVCAAVVAAVGCWALLFAFLALAWYL